MFRKVKSVTKIGKGQWKVYEDEWDTFQEYYEECKKKRDLYILNRGEDYILRKKEDKFLKESVKNNGFVKEVKNYRNVYGDRDMEAKKRSRRHELLDKLLDSVSKEFLNRYFDNACKEYTTWPSN